MARASNRRRCAPRAVPTRSTVPWSRSRKPVREKTSSSSVHPPSIASATAWRGPNSWTPHSGSHAAHHQSGRWRRTMKTSAATSTPSALPCSGRSNARSQRNERGARRPAETVVDGVRAAAQSSQGTASNTPPMAAASHSMRPHSTAGRTSQRVQTKRCGGAVTPPQPTQKPSSRVLSGSPRATWCSMAHCITRIAGRSLVHGCSTAAAAAPRARSCAMPAGPVVSNATQTKKKTMLPAVRRRAGTTSNQMASMALNASVGSAMNTLGLTSSHRST
jgi:hypothetical protein